jgi:hypothetical protein
MFPNGKGKKYFLKEDMLVKLEEFWEKLQTRSKCDLNLDIMWDILELVEHSQVDAFLPLKWIFKEPETTREYNLLEVAAFSYPERQRLHERYSRQRLELDSSEGKLVLTQAFARHKENPERTKFTILGSTYPAENSVPADTALTVEALQEPLYLYIEPLLDKDGNVIERGEILIFAAHFNARYFGPNTSGPYQAIKYLEQLMMENLIDIPQDVVEQIDKYELNIFEAIRCYKKSSD